MLFIFLRGIWLKKEQLTNDIYFKDFNIHQLTVTPAAPGIYLGGGVHWDHVSSAVR